MGAPEVFERLATLASRLGWSRATGALVGSDARGREHRLYVRSGYLVSVRSSGGDVPLGDVLIRRGHITPRALAEVLRAAARGPALGLELVARGLLSTEDLDAALRAQTCERLDLLERGCHSWTFDESTAAPSARERTRPLCLLQWVRRHLVQTRPSAAQLVTKYSCAELGWRQGAAPEPSSLEPTERRVARVLRAGHTTLAKLCADAGLPATAICDALEFLSAAGVLDVAQAPTPTPATPVARLRDPLAAARALLGVDAGAGAPAIRSAFRRLVLELHPDRHRNLAESARQELLRRFVKVNEAHQLLMSRCGA